ncbi:pyridoxal-phosphate-dependent aminotransferase family protein [Tumebacillus permanentifrigoris]|uniref:Aspartate aminotransferase-like enzyme n=1 Tax=Tumebacillus permanentifrigoris TaxID=378543 RepID=A0A316DD30_9BACL|nr:alanine--glyoxylate aminotransferase family protein [Tumebacillus permanentifrigoris]PWK14413.1 aspartate aminotransferase-like enzyme [Tumebacillus permanentifrigoris]
MFQEQTILRIPGPTPVPPQVERAMARPMIGHRGGEFSALFAQAAQRLKYVFQTEHDVYILAGSGTGGLEAAVANTVQTGDTVLVCTAGNFGDRFTKICKSYGANVLTVDAPWGEAIDPLQVAIALADHPEIKVVFATHCETSTGVLHDIQGIAAQVNKTDALLVVDAVSSLGAAELPMDAWGLDIVVTGSQKALMLPPGLCFVGVSPKAWNIIEKNEAPRFYFDLRSYRKQLAANTTPYTASVSLVFGLAEVLNLIESEGLPSIFARHLQMQAMTRAAIKALGLPLFTEDSISSPTVTSIGSNGFDVEAVRKFLKKDFNIAVAGGQGHLKGEIFRIGHMGFATPIDMLQVLSALEIALIKSGANVQLGNGVRAAQIAYLQTQEVTTHA